MKWIKRLFVIAIIVLLITPFAAIDSQPNVRKTTKLSPQQLNQIKAVVSQLQRDLKNQSTELLITQRQLTAIADLMSHTVPRTAVEMHASPYGVSLNSSINLLGERGEFYANVSCLITNGYDALEIDHCQLGYLYLPGFVVDWLTEKVIHHMADESGMALWQQTLANSQINPEGIKVSNLNWLQTKQDLKKTLVQASSYVGNRSPELTPLVETYLKDLNVVAGDMQTLEQAMFVSFRQVATYTNLQSPEQLSLHNEAAIWAMAITFANPRFADLIGVKDKPQRSHKLTLLGRQDLALHFLYSAILEINGGAEAALNIGELKELMDSMKGGTGYSFADIVADKAGIQFATYMRDGSNDLMSTNLKLVSEPDHSLFMMPVNAQPEGLSEAEFNNEYGGLQSQEYKKVVAVIQAQIKQLPLYL